MLWKWPVYATIALTAMFPAVVFAGMPSPFVLTDAGALRVQTISFFAAVFFVAALIFRWLWNYLGKSFPRMPHLSYGKAVAMLLLWGLLFAVVLTMIAGARELMTPGAWERNGAIYRLSNSGDK